MPWNGKSKRQHKPLEVTKCCCSQCDFGCPDEPAPFLARCEPCHYGERHGLGNEGALSWYCAANGHGDQPCADNDEHRLKLAGQYVVMKEMLRGLDHVVEVAQDGKWGQLTLTEE